MENVKIEPQILIEIIPSVGQEDQLQVQAEREPIDVETEAAYDELDTSTYEACHEEDDELNSSGTSKGKDLKQVTLPEMFKVATCCFQKNFRVRRKNKKFSLR